MKHFSLALQHALIALAIQIALARVFEYVAPGGRAQALGACVASFALIASGFVLGLRARRRAAAPGPSSSPLAGMATFLPSLEVVPWAAVVETVGLIAVAGVAGYFTDIFGGLLSRESLGHGGLAHVCFAVDAIAFPAAVLLGLGSILGAGSRKWTVLTALLGFCALAGGSALGAYFARYTSYDVGIVRAYTVIFTVLAALLVGFGISWLRGRIAFVEQVLVALIAGFVVYFAAAAGPKAWIAEAHLPEEQVMLALVLAPGAGFLIALTVGGSFGLLLGGGQLDPGFRYEAGIAVRHLKTLRRQLTWVDLASLIGALVLPLPTTWILAIRKLHGSRRRAVDFLFCAICIVLFFPLNFYFVFQILRRQVAISVVAVISVLGVALGVTALIVVLSVMSGFEEDLKSKILGAHAHVVLEKHGDDFYEYADIEERVADVDGVASAAAFVLGDGMISSDVGLSGTLVKGIDPKNARAAAELRSNIDRGSLDHLLAPEEIPGARVRVQLDPVPSSTKAPSEDGLAPPVDGASPAMREPAEAGGKVLPGIIIGRELSKTLHAYVGDTVKLVSPVSEEIGPTGPQPKLRRFRVAGVFYSGMYEYDAKFTYVDMKQAQSFFGKRKRATGVEIKVTDVDDTARIVEELKRRVGGHPYKVKDWREMNKELFSALLLEKLAMFIILTFIILVASFNIVATLMMIVLEKGKEIAILKALGASDASMMKVFVIQGLIVGLTGALLGLATGVTICALIAKFGVELDQKVFYIERLPVVMSWPEVAAIGIAAVVISYLATIYPAITASQLRPVEGLRDD